MKLSQVEPGTFFKFTQPGYCFGQCLYIGLDGFNQLNFIHLSASGSRFIHNEQIQDKDPEVTINIPQIWKI